MSRIDLLRMERAASSYGEPLTFLEQLELARLEAEVEDQRRGWSADARTPRSDPLFNHPAVTLVYEG
jgi:hypothetical protein